MEVTSINQGKKNDGRWLYRRSTQSGMTTKIKTVTQKEIASLLDIMKIGMPLILYENQRLLAQIYIIMNSMFVSAVVR